MEAFFRWLQDLVLDPSLLPKSPLAKAIAYASQREAGLRVFQKEVWVALDTDDLERALRVILVWHNAWMFCTTALGAQQVATVQALMSTCVALDVDPRAYFTDVLLRINTHPASRLHELTPHEWKLRFADNPMRSAIDRVGQ